VQSPPWRRLLLPPNFAQAWALHPPAQVCNPGPAFTCRQMCRSSRLTNFTDGGGYCCPWLLGDATLRLRATAGSAHSAPEARIVHPRAEIRTRGVTIRHHRTHHCPSKPPLPSFLLFHPFSLIAHLQIQLFSFFLPSRHQQLSHQLVCLLSSLIVVPI
jgi:hypothetical protein